MELDKPSTTESKLKKTMKQKTIEVWWGNMDGTSWTYQRINKIERIWANRLVVQRDLS